MTRQIFVRGMSRSGGTLMVTVLDAHPQVAMSYELYEHLLEPQSPSDDVSASLRLALQESPRKSLVGKRSTTDPNRWKAFLGRALRAGLDSRDVLAQLDAHEKDGGTFTTFEGRMQFIERLSREKMLRAGKIHWGAKIASAYDQLHRMYPQASFLFMQRDGRDMAASRKMVGDFDQSVEHIASGWVKQLQQFRRFAEQSGVRALMVHYERLTAEPETELRRIIDFLELPWDDRLLSFHDEDLTLYRNPTGHLSANQVNQPINGTSVGRWKRDLSPQEISVFEAVAGDQLEALGYSRS
ncbi:MAG TPA: sulfotransferase [Phycisphaerales bacterium]|nr:sulfotransferase [Phycisphaerales bacterium]